MSTETGKRIAAGVLPLCVKTGRILIIRRGLNQPKPGTWACFGGKFEESDQTPKETAKREFIEESGFSGKYKISSTPLYVNNDTHSKFYTFVGLFEEEFSPEIEGKGEAIDYGWFYLGEVPEELLSGFKETLDKKDKVLKNIICFYSGNC
jgi:8-oxo-dGTP pyrophosphatase MutT (NUDIX family)